ncbi:MAG TPA: DedA family protein [Rhizomicrobium sp.]|nr:DedA family protein [Rhizomicrobium sp.]
MPVSPHHHFDLVHRSVELIKAHAGWSFPVLFLVSFGESFVGVSLFFPGTTIMVIAGTFVHWPLNPHGVLDIWPLVIGAILGAVLGDSISFWLGRRFGHLVEKHRYFVRHPDLLRRGYDFFDKYGVASVFVGRFFGPVRAVIPLVAGIMEMSWTQFWFANIGSALIWAPALLLLGTVLASLVRELGAPRGWHLTFAIAGAIIAAVLLWAVRKYGFLERIARYWERTVR